MDNKAIYIEFQEIIILLGPVKPANGPVLLRTSIDRLTRLKSNLPLSTKIGCDPGCEPLFRKNDQF